MGIRFLKHLSRTRLLLHVIDLAPIDESSPEDSAQAIIDELGHFDKALQALPRWLVLNKIDCLDEAEIEKRQKAVVKALKWKGPIYLISAVTGNGTKKLCQDIMSVI